MNDNILIREATTDDAEELLKLNIKLDNESEFRAFKPGERDSNLKNYTKYLRAYLHSDNSTIIIAQNGVEIVGLLEAKGGDYTRNNHSVHIVIAILKEYYKRGIGTKLFSFLEEWAQKKSMHRLELSVFTYNQNAVALYKKMGFIVEGIKLHSFRIGDRYVDEYMMSKLL